jgi:hypothetical protein
VCLVAAGILTLRINRRLTARVQNRDAPHQPASGGEPDSPISSGTTANSLSPRRFKDRLGRPLSASTSASLPAPENEAPFMR